MMSAADLKQKLSFRSLRLLEEREDSFGVSLKSLSDSETNNVDVSSRLKLEDKLKSKSDTNLNRSKTSKRLFKLSSLSKTIVDYSEASDNSMENESTDLLKKTQTTDNPNQMSSIGPNLPKNIPTDKIEVLNQNDLKNTSLEQGVSSEKSKRTSPYRMLEDSILSEASNKHFFSEPRCLTLKKYTGEIDPFLTDDLLILQPDFDYLESLSDNTMNETKHQRKTCSVDDIFLDEEEDKKCKKTTDLEEGELVPDSHQHILPSEVPKLDLKSNMEFFYKINECLGHLDSKCKDFHATSVPEYCVKYLQRTLSNVDSMKRKLTYLLNSKNPHAEKGRKSSEKTSKSGSRTNLERKILSSNKSADRVALEAKEMSARQSMLVNQNLLNIDLDKSATGSHSRHSHRKHRSSRERPSQSELLKRKKMSILEKLGTKKEIERIQSLFKRQMNIINQHVIQKKETHKAKESLKHRKDRSARQTSSKTDENFKNMTTLEELESFFQTLKHKTTGKALYDRYIQDEKNRGALRFTSKKERSYSNLNADTQRTSESISKTKKGDKENAPKHVPDAESPNKPQDKNKKGILEIGTKSNEAAEMKKDTEIHDASKQNKLQDVHENIPKDYLKAATHPHTLKTTANKINAQKFEENKEKEINTDFDKLVQKEEIVVKDNKICFSIGRDASKNTTQWKNVSDFGNVFENNKLQGLKRKQLDDDKAGVSKRQIIKKREIDEQSEDQTMEIERKLPSDKIDTPQTEKIELSKENMLIEENRRKETISKNEPLEELNAQDLLRKKIMILNDHNLDATGRFRLKVIGNEVYLEKMSGKRKRKHAKESKRKKEMSGEQEKLKQHVLQADKEVSCQENIEDNIENEQQNTSLEDMEHFLQELRSKRKVSEEKKIEALKSCAQEKEKQFLARIRAKRKAKLMAASSDPNSTEKEAKFLKALDNREFVDAPHIEDHKQKFIEKNKAETEAIVLAEKPGYAEDDPLLDVKNFLSMIKEAECGPEAKQENVSFELKRSDVKRLENITSGKTSSLTEESQKFLNSVRAKMRAKKLPINISALMKKPES